MTPSTLLQAWNRFWFEPRSPLPICIFRILFGLAALVDGLMFVPDYLVWFGAHGAAPQPPAGAGPLLAAMRWLQPPDALWAFALVLFLWAAVFVIIGFCTRSSLLYVWAFLLALLTRNPAMWHQIDFVLRLTVLPLLFSPAATMLSVDARLAPRTPLAAPWCQRLIQFQLTMIYFEAFWGKMSGIDWRSGVAVYYATHFPDGMRHAVPGFMDHLWCYQALTYFTLVIEFCLWTFIWYRPTRYPVMAGGLLLHLGLQYFLNLDLLEVGVMAAYVCFVEPEDWNRAIAWGRGVFWRVANVRG